MSTAIRIGLIVIAVAAITALLAPFIGQISSAFSSVIPLLSNAIDTLTPYLRFGKTMLNCLLGSATVANVMLWFVLLAPLTLHAVEFGIKIYKKIVG